MAKKTKKNPPAAPAKTKKRRAGVNFKRRRRAHTTPNPPVSTDLVEFILPGFAGYAATRFVSRVVATQVAKRWPKLATHAGVLGSLASFGAAWIGVHRIDKIAQYHTPVVVGSGIAALQNLVRNYVPRYGWLVADYQPPKLQAAVVPQENDGEALPSDVGSFLLPGQSLKNPDDLSDLGGSLGTLGTNVDTGVDDLFSDIGD